MNLRARKSSLKRDLGESRRGSTIIKLSVYLIVVLMLSFGVFGSTVYFDGQSQRMKKEITINESEIYKLDREIQNLKLSLEIKSRKEYIYGKIARNNLGLRPAEPEQIVKLIPSDFKLKGASVKGQKFVYSPQIANSKSVVND